MRISDTPKAIFLCPKKLPMKFYHCRSFRILEINGATVSFQSSANRQYTLYWSTDLAEGFWSRVQSQTDIMGSGGVDTLTDAYNEFFIDPATFYRVEVEIP